MESARNPLHTGTSTASSSCLSTHNRWALNWPQRELSKEVQNKKNLAGKRGRTNKLPTFIFHLAVSLDFINDIGPCGEVAKLQIWLHVGAVRLKILRTTDGTGHWRLGTRDWGCHSKWSNLSKFHSRFSPSILSRWWLRTRTRTITSKILSSEIL